MNMNYAQAFSWLNQPGIKAAMPIDKDTKIALSMAMISYTRIEEFKNMRLKEKERYAERKKEFRDAKMWAG